MSSNNHSQPGKHPKQDFQVERIAFFSDAVFAIAITLLVIEFRAPHVGKESTEQDLWKEVVEMKYKLVSVILSFSLVVIYWIRHHTLFKHIHNYNKKIIIANMATLIPIIFFPFTTSFLYETIGVNNAVATIPYRLFLLNNVLAGLSMYYFYWLLMKRFKEMSYPMEVVDKKDFEGKLILMTGSFSLVLILSFISLENSVWGLAPIGIYNLWNKYFKKTKTVKHA